MVLIRVTLVEIDIITKQIRTKLLLNNLHSITCYVLVIERNTHVRLLKHILSYSGKLGFIYEFTAAWHVLFNPF